MKKNDLLILNIGAARAELRFAGGSMISIDCAAVESEAADNIYQRSVPEYLIYNDLIP